MIEYDDPYVRTLVLLAALAAGCGRVRFDDVDPTGDAAPSVDGSRDAAEPPAPQLITSSGVGGARFQDLAFHPDGSIGVVGDVGGEIQVGGKSLVRNGSDDMFMGVLESDGTARWLARIDASGIAGGRNVGWIGDTLFGGGFFSGTGRAIGNASAGSGQDVVTVRYGSDGTFMSSTNWGTSSNCQTRGLETSASRVVLTGIYNGAMDTGLGALPGTNGQDNGFVIAADPTGTVTHQRGFTSTSDFFVNDVALAADGSMCVTGRFNLNGSYGAGPVTVNMNGGLIAKYDAQLGLVWGRVLRQDAQGFGVAVAPNGDCIGVGVFTGTLQIDAESIPSAGDQDGFVVRFGAAAGELAWVRTFGGPMIDHAHGVVAHEGGIVVAGGFRATAMMLDGPRTAEGGADGFVTALDHDGVPVWTEIIGGSGTVYTSTGNIAIDPTHTRVGFTSAFEGEIRVGGITASSVDEDGMIVVLPLAR